jgi:ribosomal protein S18 acetylase RimI-like enzyme
MEVQIREFCMKDFDNLIDLWGKADLVYRPKGRDRRDKIENELKKETSIFLVAEDEGNLIGSVFGTHDGRKGWINRLAVSPKYRKKSIARKLVFEVEKRFDELGLDIIACMVEGWNTDSMMVFEKLGYEKYPDVAYFTKRKNWNV